MLQGVLLYMPSAVRLPLRVLWFYVGLVICAIGYALVIKPGVGAAPWDIFHLGASTRAGIPLAFAIQGTGLMIIALNALLGIRPSVGMVLNMLCVGPMLQFLLGLIAMPDTLIGRWAMLLAGIFIAGLGTGLYVSADLGTGPRDGMMIGLTRKFGLPVAVIKNAIDVTVALVGWRLGGPLGVGTVVVALLLGPAIQLGMFLTSRLATLPGFTSFVRPVSLKGPKAVTDPPSA